MFYARNKDRFRYLKKQLMHTFFDEKIRLLSCTKDKSVNKLV
jgi:hypothetical protein